MLNQGRCDTTLHDVKLLHIAADVAVAATDRRTDRQILASAPRAAAAAAAAAVGVAVSVTLHTDSWQGNLTHATSQACLTCAVNQYTVLTSQLTFVIAFPLTRWQTKHSVLTIGIFTARQHSLLC